jgi:hypothetical protein
MNRKGNAEAVLAVHLFARGFAFALLEGPLSPVDWGVHEIKGPGSDANCLAGIHALIVRLHPDVLVMAKDARRPRKRRSRSERLRRLVENCAHGEGIEVAFVERKEMHATFSGVGASTRYQIAQAIAARIHAFAHRLPAPRRAWDPEDSRLYLFDAVALALTRYATHTLQP